MKLKYLLVPIAAITAWLVLAVVAASADTSPASRKFPGRRPALWGARTPAQPNRTLT